MSFDWSKYVELAEDLRTSSGRGGIEARLRSSISRGYYGLFHQVRQFLQKEGVKFGGQTQIHQEVVQVLRTSGNRQRFTLGGELGMIRNHRNMADYEDRIDNLAQLESESMKLRRSIQQRLTALMNVTGNGPAEG